MKIIAPNYYGKFACLMGACRHSCCIGWEIDIDEEQLAYYHSLTGDLGQKLRRNIQETEEGAFFRLDAQERCPFLDDQGLCELILEIGEDSLCQICADHPRFRNFFSDREEIGLGLCCEAAGALILKHAGRVQFAVLEHDGQDEETDEFEQAMLKLRGELMDIAQDRSLDVSARIDRLVDCAGVCRPAFDADWVDFFLGLEQLDARWGDLLRRCRELSPSPVPALEVPMEQLLVYLLYRHLPGALEDGDVSGRVALVALVMDFLGRLCGLVLREKGSLDVEDLIELCRMFSSEIEYSDENIDAILNRLHEIFPEL